MLQNRDQHLFSVADYERMTALGILTQNDRVELIRGWLIKKRKISPPHASCVKRGNRFFCASIGDNAIVSIQNPIQLSDSEPEPDIVLLRPQEDFYASGTPKASDTFLVIEVADSTLEFDREVKGPLYAENGINEYWIVNLIDECLEVYRHPSPDGKYGDMQSMKRGDEVEVAALSDIVVNVKEILPPQNVRKTTNE